MNFLGSVRVWLAPKAHSLVDTLKDLLSYFGVYNVTLIIISCFWRGVSRDLAGSYFHFNNAKLLHNLVKVQVISFIPLIKQSLHLISASAKRVCSKFTLEK